MRCKNASQVILALLVTLGVFFCVYRMLTTGFPEQNKDALNALLGVLTSIWILQMQWFFGSSSSTKTKDETISDIAKAATPVAPSMNTEKTPEQK